MAIPVKHHPTIQLYLSNVHRWQTIKRTSGLSCSVALSRVKAFQPKGATAVAAWDWHMHESMDSSQSIFFFCGFMPAFWMKEGHKNGCCCTKQRLGILQIHIVLTIFQLTPFAMTVLKVQSGKSRPVRKICGLKPGRWSSEATGFPSYMYTIATTFMPACTFAQGCQVRQ